MNKAFTQAVFLFIQLAFVLGVSVGCSTGDESVVNSDNGSPLVAGEKQQSSEAPGFPKIVPSDNPVVRPDAVPSDLGVVWEAWSHLMRDYVNPSELDGDQFSERAILMAKNSKD